MILTDKLNLAQYLGKDSPVPLDVAIAIMSRVKSDRVVKNINAEKHWAMYKGDHSDYFQQRKDEDAELFQYRKKNAISANYVRYLVNLSGKYLYGRASKVSRKFSNTTETDERMRKLIKQTHYDFLMLEGAKKAGIFSEIGFRLVPIDSMTGMQPIGGRATDSTYPQPIVMDPTKTFFLTNKWEKITAVVILDEYTDFANGVNSAAQRHKTMELIVDDSRWFWDDAGEFGLSPTRLVSAENNLYGLNEEFVLAKNNDEWVDDVQDILGLNIQLDEMLTDNAHFFARHGWPQLVSSVDLRNVQHSPQHAWQIESDGPNDKVEDKLFFLQWDGRMKEAQEFIKYIEAMIFKISSTARIATGDLEAMANLRSGPAIVAAHSPSIQKTQEKQVVWSNNELNLLTAIAAFDSKIHGQAMASRYKDLDIVITFPRDFVPGEELVRAEVQQIQANSHTKTFDDIIRENHPEMSDAERVAYREEIMKDSKDVVDSEREFVTKADGGTQPSGASGSAKSKSVQQAPKNG